ncbi:MAG: methyltransferase domain-containing protein [Myxococcota bacterium]
MSRDTTSSPKDTVRQTFGRAAANYAVSSTHVGGPDLEAMLVASGLDTAHPGRLLDIGTGAGHTAFAFAPRIAQVEALDLTQEMLEQVERGARARGLTNIHCQLGDAEALPYPDDSFDFVTSRLCAHHFQDVRAFVGEVARVMQPAGTFLLEDSMAPEEAALDAFFNTFELLRDPSHIRNYAGSEWQAMLGEVGLASERLGEWMLEQEFETWTQRIGTSEPATAELRELFEGAGTRAREAFAIALEGGRVASIGIPSVLLRAQAA